MRAAFLFVLYAVLLWCRILPAEADRPGENQPEPRVKLPPSPPLSPEDALKSFTLPPGFRIEVVASEPLIQAPVAMKFDAEGRIWAVEFTGYMPNTDGKGEDEPVGRCVVLEDTDGDWKMDKSTVFLDKLVLPRAIGFARDGVLIAETPRLLYCRDKDGDLKCDEQVVVSTDYGIPGNPEHGANGLVTGLDNWIYSADYNYRLRFDLADDGSLKWVRSRVSGKGQWGLSQDDFGRFYYNNNSEVLRADCVPSHYFSRNPNLKTSAGVNVLVVKDQTTWPSRPTPGVNRGYRAGQLRANSTLATVTAACGPAIYRAPLFPAEYYGNVFVCEPAANLVKRVVVSIDNGLLTGRNPYRESEFLTSSDERFRPVNLMTGPDGALYVVDFYRGLLEHRMFLTTYLRKQVVERGLNKPLNLGRIYRIVHEPSATIPVRPGMRNEPSAVLVKHLENTNSWWRETAQRLLINRRDAASLSPLKQLATSKADPRAIVHALWTLEGLQKLDRATLEASISSEHTHVKATAIRLCEPFLKQQNPAILNLVLEQLGDKRPEIQLQLAFTLGESIDARSTAALATILEGNSANPLISDAVFSSVAGREIEFAEFLTRNPSSTLDQALGIASNCVYAARRSDRVEQMINLIEKQSNSARQLSMLNGMILGDRAKGKSTAPKPLEMAAPPLSLETLKNSPDDRVAKAAATLAKLLVPPGSIAARKPQPPLNQAQSELYENGKVQFMQICAQCHQPTGVGEEGKAPPLADSEWIEYSDERLVRIVLNGLRGPITVNGREYDMEMPAIPHLDDKTIAGCLTYLRREFGNGKAVEQETIARIRKELGGREEQWTETELFKIK